MTKKLSLFKSWLLLLFLMVGSSAAWAAEETTTYVFTSQTWTATCNNSQADWTNGKNGGGFNNNGIQVTTNTTGDNGTSPISFTNVTKIVATYNTNKSAGAGTIVAKIGDNAEVSKEWKYSSGDGRTANYTVEWVYDTPQTGNVKITLNTTTNSIYLVSVAITTSNSSSAVSTTVSIDDSGITNTDVHSGENAGSLSATVSAGGNVISGATVSWSSTDVNVATIDSEGNVTLHNAGTTTITASYAGESGIYQGSSQDYELTVTDSTPSNGSWVKT